MGIIVIMTCVQIRTYPNYKHRLRTEQSGFLYGDALMAVTLVLLILPVILYVCLLYTSELLMGWNLFQVFAVWI